MKKILSSVLCLAMMLSMGVTAFAETNDFVLTYSNEASYEITIPASGVVNKETGKGQILIEVTDVNLASNMNVAVDIYADSWDIYGNWALVNTKDSSDFIYYNITDAYDNIIDAGFRILYTNIPTSVTLYVALDDTSRVGTFTDTITFTSEIVEVENIINFTVNSTPYQAESGMTWNDWIVSDYNTGTFENKTGIVHENEYYQLEYNSKTVLIDDIIVSGANYIHSSVVNPF